MNTLSQRLAALSPEQQRLLELRLKQKGLTAPKAQSVIQPRQNQDSLPLSFAQERLWVLDQLQPEVPFYNEVHFFHLRGALNVAALEQGFNAISQRHTVLRSRFATVEGRPVQQVEPFQPFPLPIVDLSQAAETERESVARAIATQEAQQPFDLANDVLVRIKLLRLTPTHHILLLTVHHIVCDGWSVGVFIQELVRFYTAFATGEPLSLANLPIQYADFAAWQREWLQGEVLETQLAYWKQQLGGTLPVLELPTTRPRPTTETGRGAIQTSSLSPALTQALKTLSQQTGVTLFMTLLAAFNTLLYRHTRIEDILVGSPIATRNRVELEGLIGLFLNTLVFRTDVSGNPTFQELLNRVRDVALGAYAHQDVPFEKLVEELHPDRNLSQSPLFQVMFILQNTPKPALELPGLTIEPWDIDNGAATFDLTLSLQETSQGLSVSWEYNTDLFDADAIARMQGHWQTLLEGIVKNPQARLSELPLLTTQELEQLWTWGTGEHESHALVGTPQHLCIHELFEAQVEQTPDAIAVVFEDQHLTYTELNHKANQLAHQLRSWGIQPEMLVGICMETSLEMMVSIFAILKAGGAYLPLDPAYPTERLAFMLNDAKVSVLLTQTHLLNTLPQHPAQVLCVDRDQSISTAASLSPAPTGSNLAYVIYTSGSTDTPKGVMVTHRSLVNAYFAWESAYQLRAAVTCHLQMASFSFDVFSGNWIRALCSGAKLVLCPRDFLLMPDQLYSLMRREQVDCAEFVPAVLRNLLRYLETTGQSLDFMRLLMVGSDSWYVQEHQAIQRLCGTQTRLINSYGVTEATIDTTYFERTETKLSVDNLVPIGRPFPNSQVYVLDIDRQPVPIGVPGELYIGGAGVARGYLNRPELTEERFIPYVDPFTPSITTRLYRAGDLVRYLPDGNLEFLGRIDNQVKLRGFRIELGEIEATLGRSPTVAETVVVVREDEPGHKRLVAYVVPVQSTSFSLSDLRNFVKDRLPGHMVPSAFVVLEFLPLTPNGKIDRRSLPVPEIARPNLEHTYIAPQNPVETALVGIWAEILGVAQVGIDDNFFELGGDSILSIQVVAKANQQGLRMTPKQVFQYQTIAELATVVELVDAQTIAPAEQGAVTGDLPLTPIQHWFFQQELLEPHHWNQSILLEVRQAIDARLLEKAVQHLLTHHDALRLRFSRTAEGWQQQMISPDTAVPFSQVNLSNLSTAEQAIAIEQAATQLQASLNLSDGSIVRVAWFDLGLHRASRLLIVIHHLAVDGVSWRVLLEDLQTIYQQLRDVQPIKLPAKTTSFKRWAEQLVNYAQSESLQQEQSFWLTQLQKPIPPLPVDFPGGTNTVAQARTVTVTLNSAETQTLLQDVPAAYSTQINDVLLTALVQAFAAWTGKPSLLVELEGHGREDMIEGVDVSRTVGWFTAVFPVLLELDSRVDSAQALKAVKEQLRQIPNRGVGYGLLRYLNSGEIAESLRKLPQAEVSFNYLGQFDRSFAASSLFGLAQESSGSCHGLQDRRSHLFEIDGMITDGQLQMVWTYSEALHHPATVEGLAQRFLEKLRSLICHCQSPDAKGYTPSDFPLAELSQDELDAVFATVEFSVEFSGR
ncbi:amino acid adenylation domain-containing protein (plasmid) [Leptolyngbya boryana NIES-2135]|jgi:amino acid adenylation domain-containing protein/non-ribosomal peptide synthase protein (TIGR01720 family)|uniref:Amino acid adenylation domain-containing protein n=1 Tax=Leptolyngbya boryana NIES-2135 TaxID=1973484 RepID=A0A1Z4JSG0_LEPBY|nr:MULTISPECIES: non-ribosomal peptide synthetase [Leptolyngbya]BAY59705.1 amino acid adenylation domain-containing protein [Leptolyngbya boryana NIES-2135]MBD2370871.1 non-ribosomal peptide synthetase [Leptolyngbya sp. FACHB-161]MBD2377283.1 non-ribosomal peptide synthetase [Leptolyngbya sp. FACHB-238]MBD2401745.1 non-ribosomal peptide synthetase [Leptolyngbya sp. FACHB-239]MBD2408212.1 non-ribosomal peptide synthetase [Leptolyngbya sp. FACHB-402]